MATLDPILNADLPVQIHVLAAVISITLGPFALLRRTRDRLHKIMGYTWVFGMATTALSSFMIHEIRMLGPFGPIHLISIYTLWGIGQGFTYAIRRKMIAHKKAMFGIYVGAALGAGSFAFLPGRLMNEAMFGGAGIAGFGLILTLAIALTLFIRAGLGLTKMKGTKAVI